MGREHARILCRIWSDDDFRARSASAQRLYMLLLSQENLNYCGAITLTVQRWATCSPGTTAKSITVDLRELDDHRFVLVDFDTEEALVRSFVRNDGVTKLPNVFKGALRAARKVQSARLRAALAEELRRTGRADAAAVADEIDPVDNPVDKGYSIAHNTDGLTEDDDEDKPAGHIDPLLNSDSIALSIAHSTSIESKKPGGLGLGLGKGVGDRGKGEKSILARGDPDFEAFYAAYPRHVGEKAAIAAWAKAIKGGADPATVIAGAKRYADERRKEDPKFTKHAATWLNQGCWTDEPQTFTSGYQGFQNPDPASYYEEL